MKRFFKALKGAGSVLATFAGIAIFQSPRDFINIIRQWIIDAGISPPQWLVESNEQKIVRISLSLILLGIGLYLGWSFIAQFFAWLRMVKDVRQIVDSIPDQMIPKDGKWDKEPVNRGLRQFVGRLVTLHVNIERVYSTPMGGRYAMFPCVAAPGAPGTKDKRTNLDVQLYGYFDGASADQIVRIRDCGKNEQMTLHGRISRADVGLYDDGLWSLVIDLHACSTL